MKTRYLKLKGAMIAGMLALAGIAISGCKKDPIMLMYGCPEDFYRPSDSVISPDSIPTAPSPLEETL